jgi:anthranilate synthase component 2
MAKIFVLDNYDSFTYNLVHLLRELNYKVTVKRNDETTIEEIDCFSHILLSPGPGIPDEAGLTKEVIRQYCKTKKILGVCLGHQAIAEVFGAQLAQMEKVMHGKQSNIRLLTRDNLFQGLPEMIAAGRYHSWLVKSDTLPPSLRIIAEDEEKQIMAIQHTTYDVFGVQFHPESIMTKSGKTILKNWLEPS